MRLGSLTPVRDLTFVADAVEGLMSLAAWPDASGRTVQFGTSTGVTVRQLVELVEEVLGRELEIVTEGHRKRPEESEVEALVCDPSLAQRQLEWRARTDLRTGLKRTAAWIEEHLDEYQVGTYAA